MGGRGVGEEGGGGCFFFFFFFFFFLFFVVVFFLFCFVYICQIVFTDQVKQYISFVREINYLFNNYLKQFLSFKHLSLHTTITHSFILKDADTLVVVFTTLVKYEATKISKIKDAEKLLKLSLTKYSQLENQNT